MSEGNESRGVIQQWVEKAENDLRNAAHTLTLEDTCPFDTVCFHAQQCVEKYVKALLLHFDVDFPRTHDLRVVLQLMPTSANLDIDIREILPLNRYAVETRYPGDWEPITREEAVRAVAVARQVRDRVRPLLLPGFQGPDRQG